ncbi:MAG: hypothetical protein ABI036_04370 [Fibrobacteria bacterium]
MNQMNQKKKHWITLGLIAITADLANGQGRILSSRYMEFPNTAPGAVFKMEKILDEKTGEIKPRKGGAASSVEELRRMETRENQARWNRLGRLSEELEAKRAKLGSSQKIKIAIHARYPDFIYPDKTSHSREELISSSIGSAALNPLTSQREFEKRHGLSDCEHLGRDMAICEVDKDQLDALKGDEDIGAVEVAREESPASAALSTLATSAYNPGPVPSGGGSGVHAATFEIGLTSTFISCLGISATYDASTTVNLAVIRHTQTAFKALVHAAPSATFYHRKSVTFDGSDDVNYLINNAIQTVSISIERGGTSPYHSTYAEFLVMDDFAYRYPYPVFVNPTANSGYQYEVNWQGYNGISVGNVRHTNESTYEMANCTQTKNPPPVYGGCIVGSGADCAGDREMPHIVVPGIPPSGSDFATTCLEGALSVNCGTSWSAPVGNGIAADVISSDSRLAGWPEKVRAALILTAQNVDGGDWSVGGDERDGTGVISGSEAVSFAQGHSAVSINNGAVEKGMFAGSMYASDFSGGNKRFNYYVPNPKPSGKHLRAVLTWDSNPVVGGGTNALSDMDLVVQNNGSTRASASWDSNVEVVDVPANELSAGSSYYIDVSPYMNRIPASGARTNYFYYAVAWTWVKDHAN